MVGPYVQTNSNTWTVPQTQSPGCTLFNIGCRGNETEPYSTDLDCMIMADLDLNPTLTERGRTAGRCV